jgi:hypothetical protein
MSYSFPNLLKLLLAGGNGGMGGNAGHSADITVLVKEHDMDLLSLLGEVSNGAPKGGEKGNFGLGGSGGVGGRGGSSYSGHNGERVISNPGGPNGPNGVAGMNGESRNYFSCIFRFGALNLLLRFREYT